MQFAFPQRDMSPAWVGFSALRESDVQSRKNQRNRRSHLMSTQETSAIPAIDVRAIPSHERHPVIFASLEALKPRESLMIVSDHEPRPLQYQLQTRFPGLFDWRYVEQGPQTWRVVVTREGGGGCGCCCGS